MKLSVVIISKNAQNDIADAIACVSFADEVIIVDSGSTDLTVDVAKRLKAEVFEHESLNFSELRNFGLSKARGDWIFYLDTDEVVDKILEDSIKRQIGEKNNKFSAFKISRKNFYFGNHEWPYVEQIQRLFKRKALKGWYGVLHESPKIDGEIGVLDGFLLHYTHKNLSSMLEKTMQWSDLEAKLRFEAGHPKMTWWRFLRVMLTAFFDSFIKQNGYKAGVVGILESFYQSFSIFITYAKLWELQKNEKRHL